MRAPTAANASLVGVTPEPMADRDVCLRTESSRGVTNAVRGWFTRYWCDGRTTVGRPDMQSLEGVHHLGLTVTDVERSARWYRDVLGFDEVGRLGDASDERRKVFLRHEGFSIRVGQVEHRSGVDAQFDETRPGLDHLSFAVANRADLQLWCERLTEHGVPHSPVAEARSIPGALVVVFRDPDNIQLELFVDA